MRSLSQVPQASSAFFFFSWHTVILALVHLLGSGPLAQKPVLVRDINKTLLPNPSSDPTGFATLGGITYFAATTAAEGRELWRSDGTTQGTNLLADIEPGFNGSSPKDLLVVGNLLVFTAWSEAYGRELWQSDGTRKGTVLVTDIRPGNKDSGIREMTALGNTLFFVADDGKSGLELWRSQGAGAALVTDIRKGALGSAPESLTVARSQLFFTAYEPLTGRELWKSDGSIQRTTMVVDLTPGSSSSFSGASPVSLVGTASLAFFKFKRDIWKSDGTSTGTTKVPGAIWGSSHEMVSLRNRLVFTTDSQPGYQMGLYATDGTLTTALIAPAAGQAVGGLRKVGNSAFVHVWVNRTVDLWKTDGTAKSTARLKLGEALQLAPFGKRTAILVQPPLSSRGSDLWISDGTAKGSVLATSFKNSKPKMYGSGSELYFAMDDNKAGRELWIGKGNLKSLSLLKDINPPGPNANANPYVIGRVGKWVLFAAVDGVVGSELWRTDGTKQGTTLIKDIRPGPLGGGSAIAVPFDDRILFMGNDGKNGWELWSTDGSASGTVMIKDINPGRADSHPNRLIRVGERAFFIANDGKTGEELWVTDGTNAGTQIAKDFRSGNTKLDYLTSFRNQLFFVPAYPPYRLYRSDGTAKGTVKVSDVGVMDPGASENWGIRHAFGVYRGYLYFQGNDRKTGRELWRTDGTKKGTQLVKDLWPGGSSSPREFLVVNDLLYFRATDGVHGTELWTTDGTVSGTSLVMDIVPGKKSSRPTPLRAVGEDLLFWTVGLKTPLWMTRGTSSTTRAIPGAFAGYGIDGGTRRVWMSGSNGQGYGLWTTDGTRQGSRAVRWYRGIPTGSGYSNPVRLLLGKIFFSSWDAVRGSELWVLDPGATSQPRGLACSPTALLPTLEASDPVLGGTMRFSGTKAPISSLAVLYVGGETRSRLKITSNCSLYFNPGLSFIHSAFLTKQDSWRQSLFLPNNASLMGVQAIAQALFFSAASGLAVTPGQLLTLGL